MIGTHYVAIVCMCTTCHVGLIFWASPNPLCDTSWVCGVLGAASSGTALVTVTSFASIHVTAWVGSFGARAFNWVGKYSLRLGKLISPSRQDISSLAERLMLYFKH